MKSSDIRKAFLDYFAKKGHQVVPSSSLIPGNDPTLLFTNAGMVQFKDTFLGSEPRSYTRATTAQRCVRAGGKHNDLENVGYTARHHTFFEMLGNFSFGDYFKREAIQYAWEFLTQVLKLPPERLWVTVYKDDDEAADIWLKELKVSPDRFSRCGEKDNFWSMGDTGPCGPCTEIFYDHGPDIPGGPPGSAEADLDRYIEIWNLVFMQFNRDKEGNLHPLPKPSVDTGMGLERVSAVVQGVHTNYDIDLFQHLLKAIAALGKGIDPNHASCKVIADHIRACSFLITDGVLPSNEGRGYVLRRIIRRAVRHGNKLGLKSPFFSTLVGSLVEVMGEAYPELKTAQSRVETILLQEENQFNRTLEQGLKLLQDEIQKLKQPVIPGEVAFKLYDTYGFPVDLTADIARERGISIDEEGFNLCMEQQRAQSQSSSQFEVDYHKQAQLQYETEFHGYERETLDSHISALLRSGQEVETLQADDKGAIVLNHTPFYAESGGQVGDQGIIRSETFTFVVEDTQKHGQTIVHYGRVASGQVVKGKMATALVDQNRRAATRLNHTATHLLHAALIKVLGTHVQQKGSLVDADRARFDFAHFAALTPEEIRAVETLVNDKIRENIEVSTELLPIEAAKESGAVALFGEKYGDTVRVLSMGEFSKELCGGTHAGRTGDIGLFKITAEYGVASGVRRIELLTGSYALAWIEEQQGQLQFFAQGLKTSVAQLPEKFKQFLQEYKQQEKEIVRLKQALTEKSSSDLSTEVESVHGVDFLVKSLPDLDMQALRATLDQLKSKLDSAVIVLYSIEGSKLTVLASVSKALQGKVPSAVEFVRHLCGKGGGRDDMAQGGGDLPDDFADRLAGVRGLLGAA